MNHKRILILTILILLPIIGFSQFKVAVLDFEDISETPQYNGLGKAMANMLITDFQNHISAQKIVFFERNELNKILEEQNLQKTKNFDQNTAVNFGKLVGLDFIIIGNIYVLDGTCNITSRMINVETSEIIVAKEANGIITNWSMLKSSLAEDFAKALNSPVQFSTKYTTETSENVLLQYSKLIEKIDNGELEEAQEMSEMLMAVQPDFSYFKELLNDIEIIKEKIVELEKDVQTLQLTTEQIKEDLSDLRKMINTDVSMAITKPKKIGDFLSNIHYHTAIKESDFETKIDAYDQLFSNYQINFIDIYLDYYAILCAYDYSETYDYDYTDAIKKINNTLEKSCSNTELKDFLILYFSNSNQTSSSIFSLFHQFAIYDGINEKNSAGKNQHIIDKYNPLLIYFNNHANNNFIKSLWVVATPPLNRWIDFENKFFYWSDPYQSSRGEIIGNDEEYLVPIDQFKWFVKQVDGLGNIRMDFDYKNIDSYFLHKENATTYISNLQSIITSHEEFYLKYTPIKDSQEEWTTNSGTGSTLFWKYKVPEIINWVRNYRITYYTNKKKKVEGGTVKLESIRNSRSGCNEQLRCWDKKVVTYFDNGNISSIQFYDEGEKEGMHTHYFQNGLKKHEIVWDDDRIQTDEPNKCWNENGEMIDCKQSGFIK